MTIVRINNFKAASGKEHELTEFLTALTSYISNSEGCISCELLTNEENSAKLVVIEKWQSKTHHQQSIALFPKDKMAAAMNLFGEPPTGQYYNC